jgi:hypothetical protein
MSDSPLSKNGYQFWETKVYQPTYRHGHDTKTSGNYAVRIQAHGQRRNVNLGETKKRAAAKAALELYRLVEAQGWDEGLAEFRSELPAYLSGITLGDLITEVMATGLISSRAIHIYATKVRRIAGDIARVKLPSGMNKRDHFNGGAKEWRRRVNLVPIDKLSTKVVAGWRSGRLALHQENPAKLKSTVTTTNSDIRAGKALFSKPISKRLKHLTLPASITVDSRPCKGLGSADFLHSYKGCVLSAVSDATDFRPTAQNLHAGPRPDGDPPMSPPQCATASTSVQSPAFENRYRLVMVEPGGASSFGTSGHCVSARVAP